MEQEHVLQFQNGRRTINASAPGQLVQLGQLCLFAVQWTDSYDTLLTAEIV
jgi:hypothetical protein